jgi:hypothetical protein
MVNTFAPPWLAIPRPRLRSWSSFMKEFPKMFTAKKGPDPAPLTAGDFRDQLIRLINQAQGDGVKYYLLVDALEAQVVRLNMGAVSRPL